MIESELGRSMRLALSLAVIGVASASACKGPEFKASECEDEDCAGADSGGTSSGGGTGTGGEGGEATGGSGNGGSAGSSTGGGSGTDGAGRGGSDTGGSDTGGSDTGGSGGLGGLAGLGGVAGSGGVIDFPVTRILDNFAREGPSLGTNWVGEVNAYEIVGQTLQCAGGYCPATFWYQAFGASQEVFATLTGFSESASEINLVLLAQGDPDCELIEVLYAPDRQIVTIEACWDGQWTSLGTVDVFFEHGDQLGGRLLSDGFVYVYKNGVLAGSVDANRYPYIGMSGRIGVNAVSDPDIPDVWDDFGGGGG
jgi:hypothetical protein